MAEALGEDRAGHSDPLGELSNGPGMLRMVMQMRKGGADAGIARSGEPSGLCGRKFRHITAQGLDEKCFGEACQKGVAARAVGGRLFGGEFNGVFEPLPGPVFEDVHLEDGWKAAKKVAGDFTVTFHETAHERGGFAATTTAEKRHALGEDLLQVLGVIREFGRASVGKEVGVAVGEDDDVAGGQIHGVRSVLDPGRSASRQDEVIGDEVPGFLAEKGGKFAGSWGTKAPGMCKLGVKKDRAFKLDRLQDFRQCVHGSFDGTPG